MWLVHGTLALAMGVAAAYPAVARDLQSAPVVIKQTAASLASADLPASSALRIRFDLPPVVTSSLLDADDLVRHRFASQMIDVYPLSRTGFRFSAGMRFFSIQNFARDAERLTNGLLFVPRWRGASGIRSGFKRYTPAVTLGYISTIGRDMTLGLEGGTLFGRATSGGLRYGNRLGGTSRNDDRSSVNPVVRLSFGLQF